MVTSLLATCILLTFVTNHAMVSTRDDLQVHGYISYPGAACLGLASLTFAFLQGYKELCSA